MSDENGGGMVSAEEARGIRARADRAERERDEVIGENLSIRADRSAVKSRLCRVQSRAADLEAERDAMMQERDEARRMLGECYVLSGADTDGNPPESVHVWPGAVEAVRELREDYDEVCEEAHGPDGFVKQIDTLTAERDRLARILAVECGDEDPPGEWLRDTTDPRWTVFVHPGDARVMQWGTLSWRWDGGTAGGFGWGKSALEAMEAADRIREGSDD